MYKIEWYKVLIVTTKACEW